VTARSGPQGEAVDGERGKGADLEGAQQEPYGQVCGDSGDHNAEENLAVDVRALRFRQVKGA